jgi:hypothetical protein
MKKMETGSISVPDGDEALQRPRLLTTGLELSSVMPEHVQRSDFIGTW